MPGQTRNTKKRKLNVECLFSFTYFFWILSFEIQIHKHKWHEDVVVLHLNPSSSTVVTHSAFTLFAELAMRSGVRARLHTRWTSCTRITRRLRATSGHRTRVSFTVCINSIGLFALRVFCFFIFECRLPVRHSMSVHSRTRRRHCKRRANASRKNNTRIGNELGR
jgi:hypothetical protein